MLHFIPESVIFQSLLYCLYTNHVTIYGQPAFEGQTNNAFEIITKTPYHHLVGHFSWQNVFTYCLCLLVLFTNNFSKKKIKNLSRAIIVMFLFC